MIFLYNKERVVIEGLALVKGKISQRLGLDTNIVEGDFIIKEGKLVPDFRVDMNRVPLKYKDQLETIINEEWEKGVKLINDRISNLSK